MRMLLVLILALTACASKKQSFDVFTITSNSSFVEGQSPALQSSPESPSIETSIVVTEGKVKAFFDPHSNGSFWVADLGIDGRTMNVLDMGAAARRFPYTLKHNGLFYNFYSNGLQNVYMESSLDGIHWTTLNNGEPVLKRSYDPTSVAYSLWNVGADVDENGTWYLLAECSDARPDQVGVGLCYSQATMVNGSINFNTNLSSTQVVPRGGNPYVKYIQGKGLLVVHGQVLDPTQTFGSEWYITATTLNFQTGTWTTHKDAFSIGVPNVHVCDPHLADLPQGGSMLVMSVNQNTVYSMFSPQSVEDIFNQLN